MPRRSDLMLSYEQALLLFNEFDEERNRSNLMEQSTIQRLQNVVAIAEIIDGSISLRLLHVTAFTAWMTVAAQGLRNQTFSSLFEAVNECCPEDAG